MTLSSEVRQELFNKFLLSEIWTDSSFDKVIVITVTPKQPEYPEQPNILTKLSIMIDQVDNELYNNDLIFELSAESQELSKAIELLRTITLRNCEILKMTSKLQENVDLVKEGFLTSFWESRSPSDYIAIVVFPCQTKDAHDIDFFGWDKDEVLLFIKDNNYKMKKSIRHTLR